MSPPWTALTDVLLARAAIQRRSARGVAPDPLAGVRVRDEQVEALLAELGVGSGGADGDDDAVAEARAALAGDEQLRRLAGSADLDREAAEVLAACAAVELDPARQRLVGYLADDAAVRRCTFHVLGLLFGADHLGAAAAATDGPLRRAALVEVTAGVPFADRQVGVPEPVLWHLLGRAALDLGLDPQVERIQVPDGGPGEWVAVVVGADRTRRIQAALAETEGERFLLSPAPTTTSGWEALVRQATVDAATVVLDLDEPPGPEVRWWIERAAHRPWAICTPVDLPAAARPRVPWTVVRAADPAATPEEVRAVDEALVGRGHRFAADQLRQLRSLLPASGGVVDDAVRRLGGGALDRLARHIRPRRTLDDLVLADDQAKQLQELIDRYRNRDLVHGEWGVPAVPSAGVAVLFGGPSGTGKTAAAEAVAAAVGLDLYIVDVASVVSKYIGETEQNLDRVFDAASATNVVLLFDEADALFGSRTAVTDARDRYANLEVSYLLQRLERFDGLVLLTTNLGGNIDPAFLRRFALVVDFPVPAETERRRLWDTYLDALPLSGGDDAVDKDLLARRFELAGGAVRNAAVTAAFLAAAEEAEVTMTYVLLGVLRELAKLSRLVNPDDFGRWSHLVTDGDDGADATRAGDRLN